MKSLMAAGILALAFAVSPALAEEKAMQRLITLNGHGEVQKTPDMAIVNIGVTTTAETAREALASNTENMAKVLASITASGVDSKDIRTSDFSVNPRIDYGSSSSSSSQEPKTTGYDVVNNVTVTLRKVDGLGNLLDAVVQAGSNRINGIQFGVSDADTALDTARGAAVADARRKAEIYASAAGVSLGNVVSISEAATGYQPVVMRAKAIAADASPVPIANGEQTLATDVNVTWELK